MHRASWDELGTKSSCDSGEGTEGKQIAVAVPMNQGVVFICASLLIVLAFLETKTIIVFIIGRQSDLSHLVILHPKSFLLVCGSVHLFIYLFCFCLFGGISKLHKSPLIFIKNKPLVLAQRALALTEVSLIY